MFLTLAMEELIFIAFNGFRASHRSTNSKIPDHIMAQGKVLLQNIVKVLESQNRLMKILTKKVDDVQEQLKTIHPLTYLHPIPKPRQGKEFSRSTSVAGWLYDAIEALNEGIPSGQQKYLQFPPDINFRRLNSDCIRELEGLLSYYIPDLCGKVTWEEACGRHPKECEKIIREARILPELAVFAQAAGQWALRMLCANRMRTMIAVKSKKKPKTRKRQNRNNNYATFLDEDAPDVEDERLKGMDGSPSDSGVRELTGEDEIQSLGETGQDEQLEGDPEEEEESSLVNEIVESPDKRARFEQDEEHPIRNGEELTTDFPLIQLNDFLQVRGEELAARQRLSGENDRVIPRTGEIGASLSGLEIARAPSPGHLQAAAQRAASRMLDSQPRSRSSSGESSYLYKRMFNDASHVPHTNLQPKVSGSNGNSSGRINKKMLSRTKEALGARMKPKNQGHGAQANDRILERAPAFKKTTQRNTVQSTKKVSAPRNDRVVGSNASTRTVPPQLIVQKTTKKIQGKRTTNGRTGFQRKNSNRRIDEGFSNARANISLREHEGSMLHEQGRSHDRRAARISGASQGSSLRNRTIEKKSFRSANHVALHQSSTDQARTSRRTGQKRVNQN